MVLIAAIQSKIDEDVSQKIIPMLNSATSHKPIKVGFSDSYQIEWYNKVPKFLSLSGNNILAANITNPLNYHNLPFIQKAGVIVVNGSICYSLNDLLKAKELTRYNILKGITSLINSTNNNFSIVGIQDEKIICSRDKIGNVPLYFGENEEFIAIASNRKMLWELKLNPKPIEPGSMVIISEKKVKKKRINQIIQPDYIKHSENYFIDKLDSLLKESILCYSKTIDKTVVAFSGGIDSVLTAQYLDKAGIRCQLICVGVEASKDFENSRIAAKYLDLPLIMKVYNESDVKKDLRYVISSIEDKNPMQVAIGLPLYWVSRLAEDYGYNTIFTGNGCDELFGGYYKYAKYYETIGNLVQKKMFKDIQNLWRNNLERDWKICTDNNIDLRLPFTYQPIIQFGLSIPPKLKQPEKKEGIRKKIIRKLALKKGIPKKIAYKPKKAAQYSTGVNKTIRKIAKKKKMKMTSYIEEIFNDIFKL